MKKALITGITGQDGSYLAELLLEKGYQVHGIVRRVALEDPQHRLWRIRHILDRLKLHTASLESYASIFNVVEKIKPDECYHLAAQSFVSYSFEDEFSTINTNINGTMHMLSAIKQRAPKCKFYFAGCYSKDTRILTLGGLKKYNQVKLGEKIYTLNIKSNQIELKPIKKIIVKQYNGPMISIKGKRIDLLVTPNHKMLLESNKRLFYKEAQQIKDTVYDRSSDIAFPMPIWKGRDKKIINFYDFIDISLIPYNTKKNLITRMETADYLYLLGLYIGDGYTGEYKYSSNYIFFAIQEHDKARKKLTSILRKYKIEFRRKKATIEFSSATLQKMFKQSGNGVYEKSIPRWALELSPKMLRFLYDGLIDSDGNRRRDGRESLSTTSKKLMESFIELCIKLQFTPKVSYRKPQKVYFIKDKRYINSSASHDIGVNHGFRKKIYKKQIKEKLYKGIIWCLEMEGNHNFIIERKGNFYFCGNSSEMFGHVKEVPQDEDTPFHPRSPYGISKVAGFDLTRNYREAYGMFALSGILFNHESSRRGFEFVTRKITNAAAEIKLGISKKLYIGNLEAKRDWGFAGDYCKAMWQMLQLEKPEDFVIATGETHSVKEFVEWAFEYAGLDWKKHVVKDDKLYRPAEVNLLLGDYSKARTKLGWKPVVKFEKLVKMMVESDLDRLSSSHNCRKE